MLESFSPMPTFPYGNLLDLTGQRFGRLLAQWPAGISKNGSIHWLYLCDCGTLKVASRSAVRRGSCQSCGCLKEEVTRRGRRRWHGCAGHGAKRTREWVAWASMQARCYNPNATGYERYGGVGIRVCDRWLEARHGFENFLADMGLRPSSQHSLDRFPNPYGHYEPSNCRWATKSQQARNRRKPLK